MADKASESCTTKEVSDNVKSHNEALEKVKEYIRIHLIDQQGAQLLTQLHEIYMENIMDSSYKSQTLLKKILKEYPDQLSSCKESNKQGIIVYSKSLTSEKAIKIINLDENNFEETAMKLRSEIFKMLKKATFN